MDILRGVVDLIEQRNVLIALVGQRDSGTFGKRHRQPDIHAGVSAQRVHGREIWRNLAVGGPMKSPMGHSMLGCVCPSHQARITSDRRFVGLLAVVIQMDRAGTVDVTELDLLAGLEGRCGGPFAARPQIAGRLAALSCGTRGVLKTNRPGDQPRIETIGLSHKASLVGRPVASQFAADPGGNQSPETGTKHEAHYSLVGHHKSFLSRFADRLGRTPARQRHYTEHAAQHNQKGVSSPTCGQRRRQTPVRRTSG